MSIIIDYEKCCWKDGKCISNSCGCKSDTDCDGCAEACSVGAIKRNGKVVIDEAICINCGTCVEVCKQGALSLI